MDRFIDKLIFVFIDELCLLIRFIFLSDLCSMIEEFKLSGSINWLSNYFEPSKRIVSVNKHKSIRNKKESPNISTPFWLIRL